LTPKSVIFSQFRLPGIINILAMIIGGEFGDILSAYGKFASKDNKSLERRIAVQKRLQSIPPEIV